MASVELGGGGHLGAAFPCIATFSREIIALQIINEILAGGLILCIWKLLDGKKFFTKLYNMKIDFPIY